jgi:hypothetical protein
MTRHHGLASSWRSRHGLRKKQVGSELLIFKPEKPEETDLEN